MPARGFSKDREAGWRLPVAAATMGPPAIAPEENAEGRGAGDAPRADLLSAQPRVFIPHPIDAAGIERLASSFVIDMPTDDVSARRRGFASADAAIVRNLPVDAAILADAPRLKVLAKHGA